jgi:hypothetical protein
MKIEVNETRIAVTIDGYSGPVIILDKSIDKWTVGLSSSLDTDIEKSKEVVKAFQLAFDELERIEKRPI